MIIEMFLDVIYTVFEFLTRIIDIPDIPEQAQEYINWITAYFAIGAKIVAAYTPYEYLLILFGVVMAVDVGVMIYHLVMWILQKIPFASVQ